MIPSSFFDEMQKLATDEKKSPAKDIAKIVGMGLLGTAAGAAAGFGTGHLIHKAHEHLTGQRLPYSSWAAALPALGALGGVAYSVHKAKEMEAIHRALKNSTDGSPGRTS